MPQITKFRSLCLGLLLLGGVAGWVRPFAWSQDRKPVLDVTLGELMRNPGGYVGREVRFLCRFALHGSLFRREESAFSEDRDLNFAVWDMHAPLWDENARKEVSAALYLARRHPVAGRMQVTHRYQAMEVTARVESDYARIPWLRVEDVAWVEDQAHAVDPDALTLFRRAVMAMEAGEYERAAGLLTQAHAGQLPRAYRGEIRTRLDQCMAHLGAEPSWDIPSGHPASDLTETTGSAQGSAKAGADAADSAPTITAKATARVAPAKEPEGKAVDGDVADTLPASNGGGGGTGRSVSGLQTAHGSGRGIGGKDAPDLLGVAEPLSPTRAEAMRVSMIDVRAARAMVLQRQYVEAAHAYGRAIAPGSPLAGAGWLRKEIGQLYEKRYDARGDRPDLEIAYREYRKADDIADGTDGEARTLLARASLKRGAYDPILYGEAEGYAKDALRLQPEGTAARYLLAEALAATERTDAAHAVLREEPVADAVLPAAGWMVRGRIAEVDGFAVEALAAYRRVTTLEPESRVAWERIASLSEQVGGDGEAAEAYAALISMRPGHLPYRLSMGALLVRMGEAAEAAEQLQYAMAAEGETGRMARSLLAAEAARAAKGAGDDFPKGAGENFAKGAGENFAKGTGDVHAEDVAGMSAMQVPGGYGGGGAVPVTSVRMDAGKADVRHLPVDTGSDAKGDRTADIPQSAQEADMDAHLPDWAR